MPKKTMWWLIVPLMVFTIRCAGRSDGEAPGLCSLSCSDPAIASIDAKMEALGSSSSSFVCTGDFGTSSMIPVNGPITVQFKIYEELEQKSSGSPSRLPKPGISFEPVIRGQMAPEKSHSDNISKQTDPVTGTEFWTPYRWAGIVTPKGQWCTDACGVGTIEIWPQCIKDNSNEVSVDFHSGGLSLSSPITISVKNETATTE